MQIYWTKINQIMEESAEVKTYLLDCPQGVTWQEGAHIHLALEGFNAGEKPNRSLIRHMSISTVPTENIIGITTRIKEQCSEFKTKLREHKVGDKVAVFKIHSNVPLRREDKNIYLLSAGVGIATFRPLVLEYLERPDGVKKIHSLNVDSSKEYLFADMFTRNTDKNISSQFIDNRVDYYDEVKKLAADKSGLFYVVGSDEFLVQNIEVLLAEGIDPNQIKLDKHERQIPEFLTLEASG